MPIHDFVERRQGNLKGKQRRIAHSSLWNAPLGGVRFELNCLVSTGQWRRRFANRLFEQPVISAGPFSEIGMIWCCIRCSPCCGSKKQKSRLSSPVASPPRPHSFLASCRARVYESEESASGRNIRLSLGDRSEVEAVVANGNSAQKLVWRAKITVLPWPCPSLRESPSEPKCQMWSLGGSSTGASAKLHHLAGHGV